METPAISNAPRDAQRAIDDVRIRRLMEERDALKGELAAALTRIELLLSDQRPEVEESLSK